MFDSILVPFDGSAEARRAQAVAEQLGRAGHLPVEARTIEDGDVAAGIAAAADDRPGCLVVLGTHARGPIGEVLFGSVSEALLASTRQPVVLVGPNVSPASIVAPALFVALGPGPDDADDERAAASAPLALAWAETFNVDPWFVSVAPPTLAGADLRAGESRLVHRLAGALRDAGVAAQWDVLHGRDVVRSLVDFVGAMEGGVLAVTSERWAGPGRFHLRSTARDLVHRSPYPVVVLPARAPVLSR